MICDKHVKIVFDIEKYIQFITTDCSSFSYLLKFTNFFFPKKKNLYQFDGKSRTYILSACVCPWLYACKLFLACVDIAKS